MRYSSFSYADEQNIYITFCVVLMNYHHLQKKKTRCFSLVTSSYYQQTFQHSKKMSSLEKNFLKWLEIYKYNKESYVKFLPNSKMQEATSY